MGFVYSTAHSLCDILYIFFHRFVSGYCPFNSFRPAVRVSSSLFKNCPALFFDHVFQTDNKPSRKFTSTSPLLIHTVHCKKCHRKIAPSVVYHIKSVLRSRITLMLLRLKFCCGSGGSGSGFGSYPTI
jgi:hypothetical protein